MTHIAYHIPPTNRGAKAKNLTGFSRGKGPKFPKVLRSAPGDTGDGADPVGGEETSPGGKMPGGKGMASGTAPINMPSGGAGSGGSGLSKARGFRGQGHGMSHGTAPINPKSKGKGGGKLFKGSKTIRKQAQPTFGMKSFGGKI